MKIRPAAVAGYFYPASKDELTAQLTQLVPPSGAKKRVTGVLSPHAGYVYSGGLAGKLFAGIRIPPTVVILGVNHRGMGRPYAIDAERDGWETPLGVASINQELAAHIRKHCPELEASRTPFDAEHSMEVQVPFIQYLSPETSIVPIAVGTFDPEAFRRIALGLAEALKDRKDDVLLVASSDMTHYESAAAAKEKDTQALEAILRVDAESMLQRLAEYEISMCGFAPTAIMLDTAKALGATKTRLVGYCNSGDATGDYDKVVGYAAAEVF